MPKLQKYTFDNDFGAPRPTAAQLAALAAAQAEEEVEPPPPSFSEEELALAREQAFEAGRQNGIDETEAASAHRLSLAVTEIAQQIATLSAAQNEANDILLQDAIAIAMAVVHKLQPEYSRLHGLSEIELVVRECLSHLDREMRVTVRVSPDQVDAVRDTVAGAVETIAFEGKVVCQADHRIEPGDCRLEWGDGGAERHQGHLWAQIDRVVGAALASMNFGTGRTEQ